MMYTQVLIAKFPLQPKMIAASPLLPGRRTDKSFSMKETLRPKRKDLMNNEIVLTLGVPQQMPGQLTLHVEHLTYSHRASRQPLITPTFKYEEASKHEKSL